MFWFWFGPLAGMVFMAVLVAATEIWFLGLAQERYRQHKERAKLTEGKK